MKMEARYIEKVLTDNSEVHIKEIERGTLVPITKLTERRPDRAVGADSFMKWFMVVNGIDSPWMMNAGTSYYKPNPASLTRELLALGEEPFHI